MQRHACKFMSEKCAKNVHHSENRNMKAMHSDHIFQFQIFEHKHILPENKLCYLDFFLLFL
uniref:Uncharacterized protein n=1 Tax=Anguilla anguilla TaxID=7936 RepID=A0A0E9Q9X4_ANGAN